MTGVQTCALPIFKKKLLQMVRAGFSYDIAKKIINLNNEKEFLELEKYAKKKC